MSSLRCAVVFLYSCGFVALFMADHVLCSRSIGLMMADENGPALSKSTLSLFMNIDG